MSQCDACNEKRLQAQAASEECSIVRLQDT